MTMTDFGKLIKEKVEEAKLVNKAKVYLIKNKGMIEDDAYKFILNYAMNERISTT